MKEILRKASLSQFCAWLLYLAIAMSLSLNIVSCSDESSSNTSSTIDNLDIPPTECSDGFGDASRCEARDDL